MHLRIFGSICPPNDYVPHRLSTVRVADHILVLHHGRLAAAGTHDELHRTSSVYRNLVAGHLHS